MKEQEDSRILGATPSVQVESASPCTVCGACCAYSEEWPRFTCEDDATLDRIPATLVNDQLSGMRCNGVRCLALVGQIGVATSCAIYADRPDVCRACEPGDHACDMAREHYGLPLLTR